MNTKTYIYMLIKITGLVLAKQQGDFTERFFFKEDHTSHRSISYISHGCIDWMCIKHKNRKTKSNH